MCCVFPIHFFPKRSSCLNLTTTHYLASIFLSRYVNLQIHYLTNIFNLYSHFYVCFSSLYFFFADVHQGSKVLEANEKFGRIILLFFSLISDNINTSGKIASNSLVSSHQRYVYWCLVFLLSTLTLIIMYLHMLSYFPICIVFSGGIKKTDDPGTCVYRSMSYIVCIGLLVHW